jgi:hypothetical protein
MSITVDVNGGDTVDFDTHPMTAMITLAAKQSPANPTIRLPEENITIFLGHVLSIQKRKREIVQANPEQQFEWKKTLQEMSSKGIH